LFLEFKTYVEGMTLSLVERSVVTKQNVNSRAYTPFWFDTFITAQ